MKGLITITMLSFALFGCSGGESADDSAGNGQAENPEGLSEFQMEHGIGPVTEEVSLQGDISRELASEGQKIFETKCSACHKMNESYVGPPLGDVLEKRTPTYVMNMILNPVEMTKKHPEAKKMLAQYMNQMTFQNVSRDQARAIVEYLRTAEDTQEEQDESENI